MGLVPTLRKSDPWDWSHPLRKDTHGTSPNVKEKIPMGPVPTIFLGSVPTLRENMLWDQSQTGIGTSHYNLPFIDS